MGITQKLVSGGPRAVSRVLDLFQLLASQRNGMSLTEISAALDVSKSTFVDTLRGLAAGGFLIQNGAKYRLGPAAFRLAAAIMAGCSPSGTIRHYVQDLAEQTRESVGFAVADWGTGHAIYSDVVNSSQPLHYAVQVGNPVPLYSSAAGRIFLAFAPHTRVLNYLATTNLKSMTEMTLTSPEAILNNLQEIRTRGYSTSFGEMNLDTGAIAVPILDPHDQVLGALMLAAPLDRMRTNFETLLPRILSAGRAASGHAASAEAALLPAF